MNLQHLLRVILLSLLTTFFAQAASALEVYVSTTNGYVRDDSEHLVKLVPMLTQLEVLEEDNKLLRVTDGRVTGWIHRGQVREDLIFPAGDGLSEEDRKKLEDARLLHREAYIYRQRGDSKIAEERMHRAYSMASEVLGRTPTIARLMSDLGFMYLENGKQGLARNMLDGGVRMLREIGQPDHPALPELLNGQGTLALMGNQRNVAISKFKQAIALSEKHVGRQHADIATLTSNLAMAYEAQGQALKAKVAWARATEIARKVFGDDSREVCNGNLQFGRLLAQTGQLALAKQHLLSALRMGERIFDRDSIDLANSRALVGLALQETGEHNRARRELKTALRYLERYPNTENLRRDVHTALIKISIHSNVVLEGIYHAREALEVAKIAPGPMKDIGQALNLFAKAGPMLVKLERELGKRYPVPPELGQMYVLHGDADVKSGRNVVGHVMAGMQVWSYERQGDWMLVRARDTGKKGFIPTKVAVNLRNMLMLALEARIGDVEKLRPASELSQEAIRLARSGNLAEAVHKSEEMIESIESLDGPNPLTMQERITLASYYRQQGQISKSRKTLGEVIELLSNELGDHPDVARARMTLGELLRSIDDFTEAEIETREAIRILEKVIGPNEEVTSTAWVQLVDILIATGRREEAKAILEQIRRTERTAGRNDGLASTMLQAVEFALGMHEERYEDALRHIDNVIRAMEQANADKSDEEKALLHAPQNSQRALALTMLGQHDEAEAALVDCYERTRKAYGAENKQTLGMALQLASLYAMKDNRDGAMDLAQETLRTNAAINGEGHFSLAIPHKIMANVHYLNGDVDAALQSLDLSRAMVNKFVRGALADLPPSEQFAALQQFDRDMRDSSLSLALDRPDDKRVIEHTAKWMLNSKAVTLETASAKARLKRLLRSDYERKQFERWSTLRRQISTFPFESSDRKIRKAREQELQDLREEAASVAKSISSEFDRVATDATSEKRTEMVEVAEVRSAIEGESVLIELLRLRKFDPKLTGEWEVSPPEDYVAWIIPSAGSGEVRFVDLGPADRIDALVQEVRKEIGNGPKEILSSGEVDAVRKLRESMLPLYEKLWKPIAEKLNGDIESLTISPDGNLWLLPWAAIPLPTDAEQEPASHQDNGNRFLIEDFELRFVVSGRSLVRADTYNAENPPVILADPAFELSGEDIQDAIRRFQLDLEEERTRTFKPNLSSVARLPGTRLEAQSIRPSIATWLKEEPETFLGSQAAEGVFKSLVRPKSIALSTHGFFLDGDEATNPLDRCGLLMAGCNRRDENAKHTGEDGVLTGSEIIETDLRGTELVVLSACETGLGTVREGEGVAGLRQAFQLAGAESVVATLWQIPDIETARLMVAMFGELASGTNKPGALRSAQLSRIEKRRDRNGAAHPFFWAGVSLSE